MHRLAQQFGITLIMWFGVSTLPVAQIHIYSDQELRAAGQRYEPNIRGIFRQDLVRQLPAADRAVLANATLRMPLRGEHPLQFSARPSDRSIVAPVMSLKFIDDLTIAWAWFEENQCETEYLTSYLSYLLSAQTLRAGPMQAFNLPMSVINNERVNSLSLKMSKTAIYFLLAHETGHLVLNHRTNLTGEASQAQERAADNYALSAMANVGVMPAGMLQYFVAAYMFEPLPNLQTWEYNAGVIAELTHPLTSERVRMIADTLAANPMGYAHSEPNPQYAARLVEGLAYMIAEIANHMDHGGVRLYSAGWLREHYPQSNFHNACPVR
jgi:hypothetical protein